MKNHMDENHRGKMEISGNSMVKQHKALALDACFGSGGPHTSDRQTDSRMNEHFEALYRMAIVLYERRG
jgi:hypothetical protein